MGSFNLTCAVSKAPIYEGATVKLLFIAENKRNRGNTCYITDTWAPMGFPVDATYDDYGRYVIDETSLNARSIIEYLRISAVPRTDSDRHEALVPRNLTIAQIQDEIYAGRLSVKSNRFSDDGHRVSTFAVLNSVYKRLVTMPLKTRKNTEITVATIRETIAAECEESWQAWSAALLRSATEDENLNTNRVEKIAEVTLQEKKWRYIDTLRQQSVFGSAATWPGDNLDLLLNQFAELKKVSLVMDAAQIMWQPIMSCGQDTDYVRHLRINAEIMRGVADTMFAHDAECDDEFNENEDFTLTADEIAFYNSPAIPLVL